MDCINRIGVVVVLSVLSLAGCSSSSTGAAASGAGQTDVASNPVARAASEWLDAVLKGDTQRASARLTPQAMQRIIASGKQFSPPGVESPSFQVGEVRTPSPDQAIVQCILNYKAEGQQHSEEMCCLLRRVENDWRISGIAYGAEANKPWTLSDFESGQDVAIPRQEMGSPAGGPTDPNGIATRQSPPRTAQEGPATGPQAEIR